jgi:predicted nucleic acid-binding Zn ribbon protein
MAEEGRMMAKGKMNYQKEKVCMLCGTSFIAYTPNAKYCSDKCKHIMQLKYDEKNRQKYAEKKKEQKKKANALADILKAAQEAGMSYGQYVALNNL